MEKSLQQQQQKELQHKFLKIAKDELFVKATITKSKNSQKLYDKSINAHHKVRASGINKYFIDNPNDMLAMVLPEGLMLVDLDYTEEAIVNGKTDVTNHEQSMAERTINYLIQEEKKVIITKTNKGYHVICSAGNIREHMTDKSNSKNVSLGLFPSVDYKVSLNGSIVNCNLPLQTEHSTNQWLLEREFVYIGVDDFGMLEDIPIILQSPKPNVSSNGINIKFKELYNSTFYEISPKIKDGGGREKLLYTYGRRLVELGLNNEDVVECIEFISMHFMGEPMDEAKVLNIMKQLAEFIEDENNGVSFVSQLKSFVHQHGNNNFVVKSPDVELFYKKIVDQLFSDTIYLHDVFHYKPGSVYRRVTEQDFISLVTERIESNCGKGYGLYNFVKQITRAVKTYNNIYSFEYEDFAVPDEIVVFENGYYNYENNTFMSGTLPDNMIELRQIKHRLLSEDSVDPEMMENVRFYLETLANHTIEVVDNIDDMLGTILMKNVRDYKKFFILYGPGGDNGKSTFLDLISDTIGSDLLGSTSINRLVASNFAIYPIEHNFATVSGELGPSVTKGFELLKSITGGDLVISEQKGKDGRSVRLNTSLIFASNYRTKFISETDDDALNKRCTFIDFTNDFTKEQNQEFDIALVKNKEFQEHFLYYMHLCTCDLRKRNFKFRPHYASGDYSSVIDKQQEEVELFPEYFIDILGKEISGCKVVDLYEVYNKLSLQHYDKRPITKNQMEMLIAKKCSVMIEKIDKIVTINDARIRVRGRYYLDVNNEKVNYKIQSQILEIWENRSSRKD